MMPTSRRIKSNLRMTASNQRYPRKGHRESRWTDVYYELGFYSGLVGAIGSPKRDLSLRCVTTENENTTSAPSN